MTKNQKVLAWLGQWRDYIPKEAVEQLQNIVGSKLVPAHTFYVTEVANAIGSNYLVQYNEFINLLFRGDIPSEGILKIEKQLSYDQFEKVLLKASSQGKKLSDLISSMANSNKYTAGKKSLYLTLNSWLNRN